MTLDMRRVDTTIQVFRDLGTKVPSTLMGALNRGIALARRLTSQRVIQRVPLKETKLSRSLRTVPATATRLEARLQARPMPIPLIAYLDIRGGLRSGAGIGGRAYALGTIPGRGFYARMPSGHRGVYARLGRSRLPIRELMGPDLTAVITRFRIWDQIMPAVELEVRMAALKMTAPTAA